MNCGCDRKNGTAAGCGHDGGEPARDGDDALNHDKKNNGERGKENSAENGGDNKGKYAGKRGGGRGGESGGGMLLIISGPSGVGKTTITHEVVKQLGAVFSVSMTTRPITGKDREGVDYCFVDRAEFEAERDAGNLLEWAEVFGHYYGTPRAAVETAMDAGKVVILEIDVEGAVLVKEAMPEAFALFVKPPSEEELLQRLRRRAREDEATIQRRFGQARREIARADECGAYNAFVVNDDLAHAIEEAVGLIRDELNAKSKK